MSIITCSVASLAHAKHPTSLASAGYISIISASIVNQVLSKFLARLPRTERPSQPLHVTERLSEFMGRALSRLAHLKDDSNIRMRDSTSPLSFSCLSPETEKRQTESIKEYAKDSHKAFSPLAPDGRPIRKTVGFSCSRPYPT